MSFDSAITSYEDILNNLESLKKERPELNEFLDHLTTIIGWQREIRKTFVPDISHIDIAHCLKRNLKGKPFLRAEDINIDFKLFSEMMLKTASLVKDEGEGDTGAVPEDEPIQQKIIQGIMTAETRLFEECAEYFKLPLGIYIFSAHQALIPFLEAYAEQVRDNIDESVWLRGRCPVCGGEPVIGRLKDEGGKRFMLCGLCRTEWLSKRVECPFCGNDDQDTLRYFFDEDKPVHRVEVCDKCKSYIKVIDTRDLYQNVNLIAEDAATVHLDWKAKEEGYGRKGSEIFGV